LGRKAQPTSKETTTSTISSSTTSIFTSSTFFITNGPAARPVKIKAGNTWAESIKAPKKARKFRQDCGQGGAGTDGDTRKHGFLADVATRGSR
jgi:hypothetical protein